MRIKPHHPNKMMSLLVLPKSSQGILGRDMIWFTTERSLGAQ